MEKEKFPIPYGIERVPFNIHEPALFSDCFYLHYLNVGTRLVLQFYARALGSSVREDVRKFLTECHDTYHQLELIALEKVLHIAFAQVTPDEKLKKVFQTGKQFAQSQIEELEQILKTEDIHVPLSYESEINNCKSSPFSDKLMLCQISGLNGTIISNYGFALGYTLRHDLIVLYLRLLGELGIRTEAVSKVLIDHVWLDQIPLAMDHS